MSTKDEASELLCTMLRNRQFGIASVMLSEWDCDVHHRSIGGQTPLHIAAEVFLDDLVEFLIAKGADPNATDNKGRTPLMGAARVGDEKSVIQLLLHGADPNRITRRMGWTALMWAVRHQRPSVIPHLVAAGADSALVDAKGRTAAGIGKQYRCKAALEALAMCSERSVG